MLLYKDDWEEAKNLLASWWDREARRPLIQVFSPAPGVDRWSTYDNWDFCRYPDDPERVIDAFEDWCGKTYFGGVAFPNLWINYGAGVLAGCLGAQPIFKSSTMWFGNQEGRGIMSLEEIAEKDLDEANVWWRRVTRATEAAVLRHRSRYVVGMTDIGGVLDVIAALRGTVEVVKDMYRSPDKLMGAIEHVTELWHKCYDRLYGIMRGGGHEGTSAWMGIWCPGRWYPFQCDISYMFSPGKFKEFVVPHLREQCSRMDYSIYHWDGPGQIPHLKHLLELDELDGIQWVPGAREDLSGNDGGSPKWYHLYNEILEDGKLLVVYMSPDRVPGFVRQFRDKNVLVQTATLSTSEAQRLATLS